jgi:type VI secretion system secreted protein VgrG
MSDGGSAQSSVSLAISPDPGFTLTFARLRGSEELGRPFCYDIDAVSATAKADLTALLGRSATLGIMRADRSGKRYFNGIIARACFDGLVGGAYSYRLELRPWIWLLSRTQDCRIFQNQSVWDIITTTFRDAGFSDFADRRQNQAGSEVLEYCVQFNETGLDFVTRLMEVYGLYYYVTHDDGHHTLELADDPNAHPALAAPLGYDARATEYRAIQAHVWGWAAEMTLQPGTATFNDYNFTTPSADLTARSVQAGAHPHGSLEVYEYPGPHADVSVGQKLADVRMQRLAADGQTMRGVTNSRDMIAGCRFTLQDFVQDSSQNREYLVIAASYGIDAAEAAEVTETTIADTFRCEFAAIPATMPFRLDCRTRWPVMRGPQTAKVVGESGQEITTDKYGRIRVQFYWDRRGQNNQNSSCWIRVAQSWAGSGWGGMVIPRVGQEVVVDFLDGNPDRPLVTGCVYNGTNTVPYALPDNATRTTLKTNSSTGGGGFNELRFEDKKGSEEVFLHAQKDLIVVVLNSATLQITQDQTVTLDKGNRTLTLNQGNNGVTVSQGNNSVTVSQGNDSLTVSEGNHSITVTAGSSTISAGQSITLKVGANSLTIDNTGVAINGTKIGLTASAELTANGGGMMTLQAGQISLN